jgi:hypothetical protein
MRVILCPAKAVGRSEARRNSPESATKGGFAASWRGTMELHDTSDHDERSIESNRPPARILPTDGYQSVRQPQPHIDTLGELADVTLLVPQSFSDGEHRCCHRPPRNRDSENDTRCNQNGEYAEWSVVKVETHRKVRPCKICFTAQSEDTLTPEGTYAEPDGPTRMCSYCLQDVPLAQHGAHTRMCAEWKKQAGPV